MDFLLKLNQFKPWRKNGDKKRITEFEIGSQTIRVKYKKKLKNDDLGHFYPNHNEIHIATHLNGFKIDEMQIFLALIHELVHSISWNLNRQDLFEDEIFTDNYAQMFLQFLKTRK